MVSERAGRIAANQLRAAEENGEAIGVAPEPAEHEAPHGDRERPEEDVTPVVDQPGGELPAPEGRRDRKPRSRSGKGTDIAEQGVVVHVRDRRLHERRRRTAALDELLIHEGTRVRFVRRLERERRFRNVDGVHAQLDAIEPAERIRRLREQISDDKTTDAGRIDVQAVTGGRGALIVDAPPVAAAVEIQRFLREAAGPVQAMRLVGVESEELRFTDPAVDRAGQDEGMIPQNIGERDRGSAEDAAAEVVARVSDHGARDIVCGESHFVRPEREFVGVRQREGRRVQQSPYGNRGRRR